MASRSIKYFLVIYDIARVRADVQTFDGDHDAALEAYKQAEHVHRADDNVDIVLFGSDSIETLERTHASYFELSEKHADQVVARELADLGLS